MSFLLNWLLWERKLKKKQDEVNKIYGEMGCNGVRGSLSWAK